MNFIRTFGLAAALAISTATAMAQQVKLGEIVIERPWARATPKGAAVGGGYLVIHNNGKAADTLLDGTADFAGAVEVHQMTMAGNVMHMRLLPNGLDIPAGGTVTLAPNGYHLMFTGLKKRLMPGETVKATLVFAHAGSVTVPFAVAGIGAMGPVGTKKPAASSMPGMKM
jgi:copper(I)-binding protein